MFYDGLVINLSLGSVKGENMIKILAYKTNIGLFVKQSSFPYSYNGGVNIKINNILLDEYREENGYRFLKGVSNITSLQFKVPKKVTLIGYELKMPTLACEEIPLTLSKEDVSVDDEGDWTAYSAYAPLYKRVESTSEESWKDEEFEVDVVRELVIENYNKPADMQIVGYNSYDKPFNYNLSTIVSFSELEKLLTPEFLLHTRPCTINPENMYKIVRQYVRENIDGRFAEITSNYDFCMTVKRNLKVKPYIIKNEILKASGRRYSVPKFTTREISIEKEEIFNLAPKAYQQYNVASGWSAESFQDMKDQIKVYLDNLMENINKEACECSVCNGFGVVFKESV